MKSAEALLDDFLNTAQHDDSINFFRRSPYSYVIWLLVIDSSLKKQKLSIEDIEKKVAKITSRKTLYSFLNSSIKKGFLIKVKDTEDKRKSLIQPSDITLDHYSKWVKKLKLNLSK